MVVSRANLALLPLALAACGRMGFDAAHSAGEIDAAPDALDAAGIAPIHRYLLDGSLADELGGPALASLGGTLLAGGGYKFAANAGLRLTNGMPAKVYTVDLWFTFDTLGSWRKILDFEQLASDNGLYTFDASLQFVVVAGSVFETSPPLLAAGTPMRVTLTRDASDHVVGYVDGAPQISFTDTQPVAALTSADANFFIDDTATGSGEASGGTVTQIVIYDVALTAAQLAP